jgi:hypothetical protein
MTAKKKKTPQRNLNVELKPREEEIWDWVRECVTLKVICERLEIKSIRSLRAWIDRDEDRSAAYAAAKKDSAEAHAQKAKEVLEAKVDDENMSSAQAGVVKSLSNWHMKLAQVRDRETFGEKGTEVNVAIINPADEHLKALMLYGKRNVEAVEGKDYEILSVGGFEHGENVPETRRLESGEIVNVERGENGEEIVVKQNTQSGTTTAG